MTPGISTTETTYGTPLTRRQAQRYIDKCNRIRSSMKSLLRPQVSHPELSAYYGSDYNTFVFDREALMRLFDLGADYVMVMMGAKLDHADPTVVLVGATREGDHFQSLDIDFPAIQQPPRYCMADIPLPNER